MKRGTKILIIILSGLVLLFLIRLISPKEIDDVTPAIFCEEKYLEKSQTLWIIPEFNNTPISENKEWCEYVLSLNKTLGLHGVYHNYWEFDETKTQEYLEKGIKEFEECFGFTPKIFKAPQLKINSENKMLVEENELILKGRFNQIIHRVYHCDDEEVLLPNNVLL